MVGQGVLRECLQDADVTQVVTLTRAPLAQTHPKLKAILHQDLMQLESVEDSLSGLDACFYTVGITTVGTSEADYIRITHDFTLNVAQTLVKLNPQLTFVFCSAHGADTTEKSASLWARVKGKTENDLQKVGFKAVYVFRPFVIQPLNGIRSKTAIYNLVYLLGAPLIPFLLKSLPQYVTTTERLARAMLTVARYGFSKKLLHTQDINAVR